MKQANYIIVLLLLFSLSSCKYYNFTGTGKIDASSFQVNYFQNTAELIEPGIERTFTLALQDLIQNQTSLTLTNAGGDLVYEGEIITYRIAPMTATADQRAAQNRLTITIRVRFINNRNQDDSFEKSFSHYYDYTGTDQLVGSQLTAALEAIYERITQDIFNESLAKW
ncbi:MAG TPA: LptE family protein [Flavobacterium sp.]|nr:LptE family protein [Flavobacterium sp.]